MTVQGTFDALKYQIKVDEYGTRHYYNAAGNLHRTDGPAVESFNGTTGWFIDGKLHRIDGPAIEDTAGYKAWYVDGKRHRTDGPAIEREDDYKAWYINGEYYTEEEFNELANI